LGVAVAGQGVQNVLSCSGGAFHCGREESRREGKRVESDPEPVHTLLLDVFRNLDLARPRHAMVLRRERASREASLVRVERRKRGIWSSLATDATATLFSSSLVQRLRCRDATVVGFTKRTALTAGGSLRRRCGLSRPCRRPAGAFHGWGRGSICGRVFARIGFSTGTAGRWYRCLATAIGSGITSKD
jgi:hypothetical protein